MSYGLVRTFVFDSQMSIKTVMVNSEAAPILLRNSILRLLSWIQRTALATKGHYTLKSNLERGITFSYETNKKLINYYLAKQSILPVINPIVGKYHINDVVGNEVYVTKTPNENYLLMVNVQHGGHTDMVPLITVYDNGN